MDSMLRRQIAQEFETCVTNTISRLDNEETHRPFHAALLSKDALFWSRFERSFSTSFGQGVIERISKLAAQAGGATQASNQKSTTVRLSAAQLEAIENHIVSLRGRNRARRSSWPADLDSIRSAGSAGETRELRVISDLWWVTGGVNHYMSIKTVKPNIDQTAEAKRDLLKLKLNDPDCGVYFGLYYNPYGDRREDYNWAPPMGVFDFRRDEVVLIGKDYWDTLGGQGFYDELLAVAEEAGTRTRVQVNALLNSMITP
jgi:hypothetical protein